MKTVDIAAVRKELVRNFGDGDLSLIDDAIAKHTREVPEGLATRMRGALDMYRAETGGRGLEYEGLDASFTPEACAALDAMPGLLAETTREVLRFGELASAFEKCAAEAERACAAERERALAAELKMTDALNLLDEALAFLIDEIERTDDDQRSARARSLVARIAEMTGGTP